MLTLNLKILFLYKQEMLSQIFVKDWNEFLFSNTRRYIIVVKPGFLEPSFVY